ncbi:MAG: PKD domain-containing protein [Chitinophagales bacterium]|nr:PKD domain-containing protein [Bacteroidota bacterium]MCB9043904.1 PKD domain-containing protein [Chitinophagales bacterium]
MKKITVTLILLFFVVGKIFAQNEYNFPVDNQTLEITVCEEGILYDNGGPNENYSFSGGTIILHTDIGNSITLNFSEFALEQDFGFDQITIYEGANSFDPYYGYFSAFDPPQIGEEYIINSKSVRIDFSTFSFGQTEAEGFAINFSPSDLNGSQVYFSVDTPVSCNGNMNFTDESCLVGDTWIWSFGDGTTSAEQNPTHTYTQEGDYEVNLIVCEGTNCDTLSQNVSYNSNASVCFQTVMPENNFITITDCIGQLLDPGGDEPYPDEAFTSLVTIAPPATAINFSFELSQMEGLYEFGQIYGAGIRVYDGPNTFSPVIGDFYNTGLPPVGETFTANSGVLTVEFICTGGNFNQFEGFVMNWQAVSNGILPETDFSILSTSPYPFGTPIQFIDNSTNEPGKWFWDFGDGNTSTEQNPAHAYTTPGEYTVSFTPTNCAGSGETQTQTITVLAAPSVTLWSPASFYVELESGQNTTEILTLNSGPGGDLYYNITGAENSFAGIIPVVLYNYGANLNNDDTKQYNHLKEILVSNFGNLSLVETGTDNATELADILQNAQVLIIPGLEGTNINYSVLANLASTINAFAQNGGTVIFTGASNTQGINNTGLFNATAGAYLFDPTLNFNDANHPLAKDVDLPFKGKSGVIPYIIANSDNNPLIQYQGTQSVLSYREVGSGKAILFSFNYYFYNPEMEQIMVNAIKWGALNPYAQWLSVSPESGTLSPNGTQEIEILFDATGKPAGTYTTILYIETNDPNVVVIPIPCTIVITGSPQIIVDTNNLDFGNVVQFTTESQSLVITNTGADTLFINNIVIDNEVFSVNDDSFWIFPGFSYTLTVSCSPDVIEMLADIPLTLQTNAGDVVVYINANVTGAPLVGSNPTAINYTIDAGNIETLDFDLLNPGQGELEYTIGSTISGENTGFIFTFTTDSWGNEFYWELYDSNGNLIATEGADGSYSDNTQYTIVLGGLSADETYTLELLDSFGDGALPNYSLTDITTGTVFASGSFSDGDNVTVPLSSPTQNPIDLWLQISPQDGTVPFPDGSQAITLTFDATTLLGGVYQTNLVVTSNDPTNPVYLIPVTLTVIGIPQVNVSESALDFGSLVVGTDNALTFTVNNIGGTDDLVISNIVAGNNQYEVSPSNLVLNPGETATVTITFAPNMVGVWNTDLTLFTNTEQGNIQISLLGEGQPAPLAGISNNNISITLQAGDTGTINVVLSNNGGGELQYTLPTNLPGYLAVSSDGNMVAANGGEETIVLDFDADGLSADVYNYTLIISTNDPQNPTLTINVTLNVIAFPQAAFNANTTMVCGTGIAVQFTDMSVNVPTQWLWNFGDGTTSTQSDPTHIYTENGTYTITLTVSNDLGEDTFTLEDYITVDLYCIDKPIPTSGNQQISGCNGNLYDSGGANGSYANFANGSVTVTSPGATQMTLSFSSFQYELGFDSLYVYQGTQAISSALVGAYSGNSLPNGGTIVIDGPSFTLREKSDDSGTLSGFALSFACSQPSEPPTAAFSYAPTSICSGLVNFQNQSLLGSTYSWDFGDGSTSSNPSPVHQYNASGTYDATLSVSNSFGSDEVTQSITIDVLVAEVGICETVKPNTQVQFKDNTQNATGWFWQFGNGSTSTQQNPVTTYTSEGTYTVIVTILNTDISSNCKVEINETIEVSSTAPDDCVYIGIEDIASNTILQFYPNPAQTNLYIHAEKLNNSGFVQFSLQNVLGQTVYQNDMLLQENQTFDIDISQLPSGTYFAKVIYNDKVYALPVSVQH